MHCDGEGNVLLSLKKVLSKCCLDAGSGEAEPLYTETLLVLLLDLAN